MVWDAKTGREILALNAIQGGYGIALSPDGHLLASATGTRVIIHDAMPEKPFLDEQGQVALQ